MGRFYHLTPDENVDAILEEGLRPGPMGVVCICTNWQTTASLLRATRPTVEQWALLEVDATDLDPEEFYDGMLSPLMGNYTVAAVPPEAVEYVGQVIPADG